MRWLHIIGGLLDMLVGTVEGPPNNNYTQSNKPHNITLKIKGMVVRQVISHLEILCQRLFFFYLAIPSSVSGNFTGTEFAKASALKINKIAYLPIGYNNDNPCCFEVNGRGIPLISLSWYI